MRTVRTRVAPSPTGYPHIGTIYQALFNYAFAKKHGGTFIVRIEDTDRARFVEDAEKVIFDSLDWFGLIEDESPRKGGEYGPYRQSERLSLYYKYAEELIEKGFAYYSYYPKEKSGKKQYTNHNSISHQEFETNENPPTSVKGMIEREDWVVRMKILADHKKILINDEIRGTIEFDPEAITQQILIKSDGFPTYHFAVVIDDHLMKISHIVRAEEWISSAPKHVLLYQYFGWETPLLYHTATLRNPDKSKLSKRHGHTNVLWYMEHGYLPEAILNYLALLGWTHPEEKELFALDEFIQLFDLNDIRPVAAIFDLTKLTWMNGEYIRKTEDSKLTSLIFDFYKEEFPEDLIEKFIPVIRERIKTLGEFKEQVTPFLTKQNVTLIPEDEKVLEELKSRLSTITDWDKDTVLEVLKTIAKEKGFKFGHYYEILFGIKAGLPLADTFEIIGKEKALDLLP